MNQSEHKGAAIQAGPANRPLPQIAYPAVLQGQPSLVTGANSGIGKAVAMGMAAAGADVAVNYVVDPVAAEDIAWTAA